MSATASIPHGLASNQNWMVGGPGSETTMACGLVTCLPFPWQCRGWALWANCWSALPADEGHPIEEGEEEKGRKKEKERRGGEEGEPLYTAKRSFTSSFSSYLAMELLTLLLSLCTHLKSSHAHTSSLPSVSRTLAR